MKKIVSLAMLLLFSISLTNAQTAKSKKDPTGNWKFEAPLAPEGYTTGNITIGLAEKKYTVTISMPGSDYKIKSENVKFENDSLKFSVYVEDENVVVKMKMEDAVKMTGAASTSEGVIPLTAAKQTK